MIVLGELINVGDLVAEDVPQIAGVPGIQLRTADGRILTISGLTHDEARRAAAHFGERVSVALAPDPT